MYFPKAFKVQGTSFWAINVQSAFSLCLLQWELQNLKVFKYVERLIFLPLGLPSLERVQSGWLC